jgi:hypothetical protein
MRICTLHDNDARENGAAIGPLSPVAEMPIANASETRSGPRAWLRLRNGTRVPA